MALLIVIGACVLWCLIFNVARDMHTEAKHRWEDEVMTDYLRAEDARYHRYRLEEIDRAVQATSDEMARIGAEARGEIIEGSATEIEPR